MVPIFTLIVLQLIGEVISRSCGLPIPGAVIGLILLYLLLWTRWVDPDDLGATTGFLHQNLGLLFVPAGVGVIAYLPMIADEWAILLASILFSVVATLAVTGLVMAQLARSAPVVVEPAEGGA
jgi:holin-like protein